MVGAIIGDLAAWTWEHDKNAFYKMLITPEAVASHYREDMLLTADLLMRQKDISHEEYKKYFIIKETPKRGITLNYNQQAIDQARERYGFFAL